MSCVIIHVLSAHARVFQILVVAKNMACQALEHTVFVYDQELEQDVDMDTFQLEEELEANTEVEEEMEMIIPR